MKHRFLLIALILSALSPSAGQDKGFAWRRAINGVEQTWHRLHPDPDIFGRISPDARDIRILGIRDNGDTVEAPYILNILNERIQTEETAFERINETSANGHYFYTFRNPGTEGINEIGLAFADRNFDWLCRLEGSNDQLHWYSILDNYRILSIENALSDYSFTKLSFPQAEFRYMRLRIANAGRQPSLLSATFTRKTVSRGVFREYSDRSLAISRDRNLKQTLLDIDLGKPLPVSQLLLQVGSSYDYYRPFRIEYLLDSTRTDRGWHYNYGEAYTGTLSSLEESSFTLPNIITKRLRVLIEDRDNQPLAVTNVTVKGSVFELTARFTEKARYFLVYGNERAERPDYDLEQFRDRIPADAPLLSLGNEESLSAQAGKTGEALFANRIWLWAVLLLVIAVLGWFTLKMIQSQNAPPGEKQERDSV